VKDNESDVIIDSSAVDTASNRTQRSIYSTGPQFQFQLDSLSQLSFSTQYELVDLHQGDSDSERYQGNIILNRRFGSLYTAGVSSSYNKVDYKTGSSDNYDATNWSVFAERRLKQGALSLSVGRSATEYEEGLSSEGDTWALRYQTLLSRQSVNLSVSRTISDSATSDASIGLVIDSLYPDLDAAEKERFEAFLGDRGFDRAIITSTIAAVSVGRAYLNSSLNWAGSYEERTSDRSGLERISSAQLAYAKTLNALGWFYQPRLSLTQRFSKTTRDGVIPRDYSRKTEVSFNALLSQDLRFTLSAENNRRNGDQAIEYEENRIVAGLSYQL
jgi:hypothetical protein